jgi:nucleotide-binding universal stress UspA family protein
MTLVVLGIDALDHWLIDDLGTDELKLDESCEVETFSHMKDIPLTQEVWPTVATGLDPEEHGITESGTNSWDNPVVDFASNFTWMLDSSVRSRLGNIASDVTGAEYSIDETDESSVFDGRYRKIHDWPGVHNSEWLQRAWQTAVPDNHQTEAEFRQTLQGIGSEQLGWVRESVTWDHLDLVATHVHTLDMGGHVFSGNRDQLQDMYRWMERHIEEILETMDENDDMLILSDHGMVTEWCPQEDMESGEHSFRAVAASTTDSVPESVYDCRDWIELHIDESDIEEEELDVPEEQLESLGYI